MTSSCKGPSICLLHESVCAYDLLMHDTMTVMCSSIPYASEQSVGGYIKSTVSKEQVSNITSEVLDRWHCILL